MGDLFGSLIEGAFGMGGAAIAANQSKIAQNHANSAAEAAAQRNIDLQREFAREGIRWKVEDARLAGIHPLYALGSSGASFSPVNQVSGADFSKANFFRDAGQHVGRAIRAASTGPEREMSDLNLAMAKTDLEGKTLDNQIRAAKLATMTQTGPQMPAGDNFIPGQGNGRLVDEQPLKKTVSAPGRPAQEAGWRPDVSYSRTDTGLTPMVPESLSESLEDDFVGKILWRMRNQMMPNLTGEGKPPTRMLPAGAKDWDYDGLKQEWTPTRNKGSYPLERAKNWFNKSWNAPQRGRR